MKIAIIHWYRFVNSKSDLFDLYAKNLEKSLNVEHFDVIISLWWFTNKDINKSEAETIKEALYDRIEYKTQWILEKRSFTTFENVEFCAEILDNYEEKNIAVFCKNTHLPKIVYLSLRNYLKLSKNESLKLIRDKLGDKKLLEFDGDIICEIWGINFVWFDLEEGRKELGKAIRSGILETHYDDCPELHQEFLEFRKKSWGLK